MGLMEFLSLPGQERTRRRDEFLGGLLNYYLGPTGIPERLVLPDAMNIVSGMGDGMTASQEMLAPNRTAGERLGSAAEMLASVAGAVGPAAAARVAGGPAAQAMSEGLLGFGGQTRQGLDEATRQFLADESGALSVPELLTLDPNAWRSRIEQSLPPSWLDPKFDKPQWHGISNVSSSLPAEEMAPVVRSTGTLAPEAVKTIESLVGRTGIPALGDRSVAGNEVLGIGNVQYANPVRSLGGADFMREQGTGIWANAAPQAEDLASTAEAVIRSGGDPALIYTAMGPQSADFSTMMAEAVLNQYDPRRISPEAAAKYDEAVRKVVPNFTSILNPNFLEGLTGTDRWNLWQLMDKAALKDAGFPDINLARRSITDPRLMDVVPFDSGLTVGRPTGGLLSSSDDIVAHPTYPAQLEGAYEGGLPQSIPGPILWRDFFNARRSAGASPGSDQRSFLMNANRMAQTIDQQTVDEANQFMEYLRGLNDPTSPFRLWRGLLDE